MSSIGTGYDLYASQFSPDGRVFQVLLQILLQGCIFYKKKNNYKPGSIIKNYIMVARLKSFQFPEKY